MLMPLSQAFPAAMVSFGMSGFRQAVQIGLCLRPTGMHSGRGLTMKFMLDTKVKTMYALSYLFNGSNQWPEQSGPPGYEIQ